MKLVSFDIGIKNMAYCVFDITQEQHVQIIDWNVINLSIADGKDTENQNTTPKCNCYLKKGNSVCGKKAHYFHYFHDDATNTKSRENWYCEKHAKLHPTLILPKKEYEMSQIKKKKVGELATWYQSLFGPVPTGCKKETMVMALVAYYTDNCFAKYLEPKKVNAKDIDLISIGRAIKHHFDLIPSFSGANMIVIENQISTIATRMKTIQGMVAQYFIMRSDTSGANIEFVSSANKLKGFSTNDAQEGLETIVGEDYDQEQPVVMNTSSHKTKSVNPEYKQHKSDGVCITQQFIDVNPDLGKWCDHFNKHKKRDDLADCFLQGVWYCLHHKIFSYAENLKINSV